MRIAPLRAPGKTRGSLLGYLRHVSAAAMFVIHGELLNVSAQTPGGGAEKNGG